MSNNVRHILQMATGVRGRSQLAWIGTSAAIKREAEPHPQTARPFSFKGFLGSFCCCVQLL